MIHDISITPNALALDECSSIIEKFSLDTRVLADPQPDYSQRRYLNISNYADWFGVIAKAVNHTENLASSYFSRPPGMEEATINEWIDDGFIIAHYKKGDDLALHVDGQSSEEGNNGLRLATVLFFLNTPLGGELDFPLQNQSIPAVAGTAVMFPVSFTHPHKVLTANSDRYILQTWLTDPRYQVIDA